MADRGASAVDPEWLKVFAGEVAGVAAAAAARVAGTVTFPAAGATFPASEVAATSVRLADPSAPSSSFQEG